ncbi:unnamed protein product [Strongylus vulgaris]|uniref:Uncharacterized protein n=1 Tax=Strongylus vulgaris TaxID=40348 RepID=A0A3P7JU08_STRVU|nr:unnamed protein product [Strongylus vulgaris]
MQKNVILAIAGATVVVILIATGITLAVVLTRKSPDPGKNNWSKRLSTICNIVKNKKFLMYTCVILQIVAKKTQSRCLKLRRS